MDHSVSISLVRFLNKAEQMFLIHASSRMDVGVHLCVCSEKEKQQSTLIMLLFWRLWCPAEKNPWHLFAPLQECHRLGEYNNNAHCSWISVHPIYSLYLIHIKLLGGILHPQNEVAGLAFTPKRERIKITTPWLRDSISVLGIFMITIL